MPKNVNYKGKDVQDPAHFGEMSSFRQFKKCIIPSFLFLAINAVVILESILELAWGNNAAQNLKLNPTPSLV
jgi:hypothetical protein